MLPESGEKGSCNDPEEDTDEYYMEYCPGSVVWAKLEGYPWWPAMVDEEPDTEEFYWIDNGTPHYNVTFLDEKPTRAWIPERFICHFLKSPEVGKRFFQKPKQNRYAKAISKAKEVAEAAMKMTIKDRLETYTFAHLYKGHWPAAPNFDESDVEENENKKAEAIADTLLKELDELGSIDSSDTDDEKTETDFCETENNKAKEGEIISKTSDGPSFKKKENSAKNANDKDFTRKKGAISSFMEKKKSKILNSFHKNLNDPKDQTALEYAESITNPLQEKKAKGIKRKKNRESTPKKQKNIENPTRSLTYDVIDLENTDSERESEETKITTIATKDDNKADYYSEEKSTAEGNPAHSLTDDIIDLVNTDSGHESDETLNIGTATKEDKSKTAHDSGEKIIAEGNKIVIPEMHNHEKLKTEKKSNNVKPLKEKEFKKAKIIQAEKNIQFSHLPSKEEISKHMDESISKVSQFSENETSAEFNEYNKSEQEKMIKTSKELQKKILKPNKTLSSSENNKQSKNKIETLKKSTKHPVQEPAETMILQNVSHSSSKTNKQKITGTTTQKKKSPGNIKPVFNIKIKESKQLNSSFSIPIKSNAEINNEMVMDKADEDMNKEKKELLKLKIQNPQIEISAVKAKPNFKLPVKTDKQCPQAKTKDLKILPETGKLKAVDSKQKQFVGFKENCSNKVGSGQEEKDFRNENSIENMQDGKDSMNENSTENMQDEKDSMKEKSTENIQGEKCVSDPKENLPGVLSNDIVNATENEDENLFYVSASDEEMDCEILDG